MEEDWDTPASDDVDNRWGSKGSGRSFSRGRGFSRLEKNDDLGNRSSGYQRDSGDRGSRSGYGGGRSFGTSRKNGNDDEDWDDDAQNTNQRRYKSSTTNRGSGDAEDNGGWKDGNDDEDKNSRPYKKKGSGGYSRNDDNDDWEEDSGYKGTKNQQSRRNDGDADEDDWGNEQSSQSKPRGRFGGGGESRFRQNKDRDETNGNEDGDGWDNDRPSRGSFGRGRGGGGRGRGGFRGNFKFGHNDEDKGEEENNDWNDDGESNRGQRSRGGGRGRGRGGFSGRGRGDFDNRRDDGDQEENSEEVKKPREIYVPPEPSECEEEMFQSSIQSGINFGKYDNIPITVSGENIPNSINSFKEANLRTIILENIKKSGYQKPTPIQKTALPIIMAGRDVMACAQTGSGKTAAFLLPIINYLLENKESTFDSEGICKPQALVISPTRELAIQIGAEARKFAHTTVVKTVVVYGGASTMHQANQVSNGCHILVATPGRLNDFLERRRVSFAAIRFVVLDEADRMLDMGFQSVIQQIMNHETMVSERQTLLFSATFPEEIQNLGSKYLNDYAFITVGVVGSACTDVEQNFFEVNKFGKREKLLQILQEDETVRTVIFIATKRNTDFVAAFLSEKGLLSTSIHGDRLQREREEALREFRRGSFNILVATDVAARGLDIKNVDHVINYDLPKDIDEYVHRIGRTGRVGNKGRATSFYDEEQDAHLAPDLVKILRQADQTVPNWLERAAAGGSSSFRADKFGGQDIRNQTEGVSCTYEPEEEW